MDPLLRPLDKHPLNLHALHLHVMQQGGFAKIEGNDNIWSIIAARHGHVHFPGSATEPARSGPEVAQAMHYLYKEYIAPFEAWYVTMVQEHNKQLATVRAALSATGTHYSLQQLLQMVNMSPADLQSQGVDEKTMQILESQKGLLQRLLQQSVFVRQNPAQNTGHGGHGTMGH